MLLIEDWPGPEIRAASPPPASLDQTRLQRAAKCSQVQEWQGCMSDRERETDTDGGREEEREVDASQESIHYICWTVVIHKDVFLLPPSFGWLMSINHQVVAGGGGVVGWYCLSLKVPLLLKMFIIQIIKIKPHMFYQSSLVKLSSLASKKLAL